MTEEMYNRFTQLLQQMDEEELDEILAYIDQITKAE